MQHIESAFSKNLSQTFENRLEEPVDGFEITIFRRGHDPFSHIHHVLVPFLGGRKRQQTRHPEKKGEGWAYAGKSRRRGRGGKKERKNSPGALPIIFQDHLVLGSYFQYGRGATLAGVTITLTILFCFRFLGGGWVGLGLGGLEFAKRSLAHWGAWVLG
jgi:hypothetical protein